jgi:NAD(P)-dependent dehydrogenase (short-subunit alcohol dehydrogenase family)
MRRLLLCARLADRIHEQGGTADFVAADLSDEADARQLAKQATELGGGHVDILVNNAGTYPFGPTDKATEDDFDRVFSLNVKVPFFLVAELASKMAARGHGVIINVSTMVAEFGMPQMALYGSSKAALILLTKSWAADYGPAGVRVNAVSPSPPAPRAPPVWARRSSSWPPLPPMVGPGCQRRSPRPSSTSPAMRRASCWALCCPSTAAGSPSDLRCSAHHTLIFDATCPLSCQRAAS